MDLSVWFVQLHFAETARIEGEFNAKYCAWMSTFSCLIEGGFCRWPSWANHGSENTDFMLFPLLGNLGTNQVQKLSAAFSFDNSPVALTFVGKLTTWENYLIYSMI